MNLIDKKGKKMSQLPNNIDNFSLAQLDAFMQSVQNKINHRIEQLHRFVADNNLQAFKAYYQQHPDDFSDEVWTMLPGDYLYSHNLSIPRMEFMQYLMQETTYFDNPYSTKQALVHENIIGEACNNLSLMAYMKKNEFWQPLLKEFCLNTKNLMYVQREEVIHSLYQDNYLTINKELIDKLNYNANYLNYALKHHLIAFSDKEYSQIYRNTWWQMNSEFLIQFYEQYVNDKTKEMDLHTILEATNQSKGTKTAGMSKMLSADPAICQFMLSHHYVSEKMALHIVEHVLKNYTENAAKKNFQTFCHTVFSHYPDLTDKIMTSLKILPFKGSLIHGQQMLAVAEKIAQYEKVNQIVQNNAEHQPSEANTPFKAKI